MSLIACRGLGWPEPYPGRALRNAFTDEWHGHEAVLAQSAEATETFRQKRGDYDIDYIYAGQAMGLLRDERPAAEIVSALGEGAEQWLRARMAALLGTA